ncbi:hypothetical protein GmHk_08G023015 [Glycine max]|nr:hypothetical protein GmHk_08G023015 [Glycine max]
MSFPSPSFFQNHFQRAKLLLHHPQPPVATTNRRCSPLKPHTERNPSTEAESSNLPRNFGRERSPNLTFRFPSSLLHFGMVEACMELTSGDEKEISKWRDEGPAGSSQ